MINFIQKKSIDFDLFKNMLAKSQQTNQFCNSGPAKFALEEELRSLLRLDEDKSVLCTANGTLALHAIYLFLKKRNKNIKFVSPSFTFPSCNVSLYDIELLDIDHTYTMPLTDQNMIKYDAFVITNLFGTYPSNITKWIEKSKKYNKILIFDNASSPMTEINGINMCNFGDFSFGSLHHTKFLGFGEGGFVVMPKEYYDEFEKILGFGFVKGVIKRKHSKYSSNYKMSDVAAAAILQQIQKYDIEKHKRIQDIVIQEIKDISGLRPFNYFNGVVYGNLPLLYDDKMSIDIFRKNDIEAQKYYYPLVEHKNSIELFDRIINLPLNSSLTEKEIEKIIDVIKGSAK